MALEHPLEAGDAEVNRVSHARDIERLTEMLMHVVQGTDDLSRDMGSPP